MSQIGLLKISDTFEATFFLAPQQKMATYTGFMIRFMTP